MTRSMIAQGLYLKKESTPGTAETTGMQRFLGLKMRPGWNVETEQFRAEGYKMVTANQILQETGQHTVEAIQDFNAMTPILASVLSYGGATQPDSINAPDAYEHTFELKPRAEDTLTTFTAIYGDSSQALQMVYLVFNSLTFGVQRGSLTLETSAISKAPTTGASLPLTPTEVPAVPVPATAYDVYVDDTWSDAGTTQAKAVYDASLTIGDKRVPVAPIDSTVGAFATLLEGEDIDFSGAMTLGFDADAVSMISSFRAGEEKIIHLAAQGPEIASGVSYGIEITASVKIGSVGEIGAAPNAPVVSLPFEFFLTPESVSGNVLEVTLTNTVSTL